MGHKVLLKPPWRINAGRSGGGATSIRGGKCRGSTLSKRTLFFYLLKSEF